MKYMSFHSSCSYAGLANMLHFEGIEVEDWEIAMGMKLPYLFWSEDGSYLSGPMLQSAEWFDLYLNQIGFRLIEQAISKSAVIEFLTKETHVMLGIYIAEKQKHAVVYLGQKDGKFQFLNNRHKEEEASDYLYFQEDDLLGRIAETTTVATLKRIKPCKVQLGEKLETSIAVFTKLEDEIVEVCGQEISTANIKAKLNTLFRPILLDGISMLKLIKEDEICNKLIKVQKALLSALKSEQKMIRLADCIPLDLLIGAMDEYLELIKAEYNLMRVTQ